jgi:trehalose transport system permease protein
VVTISDMWKVTPLVALILLAGLENISRETHEAAGVDGAARWARFRYITLPLLRPAIGTAMALRAIDAFRIFEIPLILAGKSTPVLSSFAYFEFNSYNNANTSAAAANILTLIIFTFVLFYLLVIMERERG